MKLKTSELSGVALDWAVAKCEGYTPFTDTISWLIDDGEFFCTALPKYSTDWAQGGAIIAREGISIGMVNEHWQAHLSEFSLWEDGPTPLIAVMRCYVASKLGDEVEVPDEVA